MKRFCCLLAVLLCLVLPMSVCAEAADTVKQYELGAGGVDCLTSQTAFWEYPLLEAGQCRLNGTLQFTNRAAWSAQVGLLVTLPYDNTAALGYLNYVRIRVVRDDGTVVYDGPYCRIADNGRLDDGYVCAPDRTVSYSISLWCAYDYAGDLSAESDGIAWQIAVSEHHAGHGGEQAPSTPSEVWVLGLLVGVAVLAVCLLPRFRPSRKRSRRRKTK